MGKYEKMVIELSGEQADLIRDVMADGIFATPADVVGEALEVLRDMRELKGYSQEELKRLIEEGLDEDGDLDADVFFKEMKQELEARVINEKA